MRIISGKFKGRTLFEFRGNDIRPTSDKSREGIFSILQNRTLGSTFLDLFGGTGSVGIEALSRGAKKVVFCDREKEAHDLILKNLAKVGASEDSFDVFFMPALFTLKKLKKDGTKFDLIFLDPPYGRKLGIDAVEFCDKHQMLMENGLLIFECGMEEKFKFQLENLEILEERNYGRNKFTFFQNKVLNSGEPTENSEN